MSGSRPYGLCDVQVWLYVVARRLAIPDWPERRPLDELPRRLEAVCRRHLGQLERRGP